MTRDSKMIETELGARPVSDTSFRTRSLLQEWLTAQGIPLHRIRGMRVETMLKCYNFPRYMAKVARSFIRDERDKLSIAAKNEVAATVDMEAVQKMVREQTKALINEYMLPREPQVVEIVLKDSTGKKIASTTHQHKQFETLLRACSSRTAQGHRLNVMMVGPAGSGKTTAAEQVAKVLNVPFFFNGAVDTEYKLLGFTDANGKVVKRPFREAFSKPSVYLFDEIDGSHPNGTLPLNSALANGAVDFPDMIAHRHKDCVIIAAANTWGFGGTPEYVGRNRLDGAFLDRFVMLHWDIDEELERSICRNALWVGHVQRVRRAAKTQGLKVIISPRATYNGEALIESGIPIAQVAEMTLRKGMSEDQWKAIGGSNVQAAAA